MKTFISGNSCAQETCLSLFPPQHLCVYHSLSLKRPSSESADLHGVTLPPRGWLGVSGDAFGFHSLWGGERYTRRCFRHLPIPSPPAQGSPLRQGIIPPQMPTVPTWRNPALDLSIAPPILFFRHPLKCHFLKEAVPNHPLKRGTSRHPPLITSHGFAFFVASVII